MHKVKKAQKMQNVRKHSRRKRRPNPYNKKTLLWLLLFFPVGVTMMWKHACSWRPRVKAAVSVVAAALVVAVFFAPAAPEAQGGIRLVGARPEAEIYGPELPKAIVQGYTRQATGSVLTEVEETDVHYVYAADNAECYHEYECKFAYASSQRLTVYEAYFLGFDPGPCCNPPVYRP